jgi:hypothetical protein
MQQHQGHLLNEIISVLEREPLYAPAFSIWQQLIDASASYARQNEAGWKLVVRVFKILADKAPHSMANSSLLKQGLDASVALGDTALASKLIIHSLSSLREEAPSTEAQHFATMGPWTKPEGDKPQLPFQDVLRATELCVGAGDMASCQEIVDTVNALKRDLPSLFLSSLYLLQLKGFATKGDVQLSQEVISAMEEKELQPG